MRDAWQGATFERKVPFRDSKCEDLVLRYKRGLDASRLQSQRYLMEHSPIEHTAIIVSVSWGVKAGLAALSAHWLAPPSAITQNRSPLI